MSITSGFYNSYNGDRRYNAEQMSAIFGGIINDGVFSNIGDAFSVKATTGNTITVGIGRAWFNSTWLLNDSILTLTADTPEVLLGRYDAVVIEVNRSDSVRAGDIKIVKGTPASSPEYPELTDTDDVHQYPLAYIYRVPESTAITQANITNMVGTSDCPYITGILETQNIDNIVAQWEAEWNEWFLSESTQGTSNLSQWISAQQEAFESWFNGLQDVLDEDTAANLASQISKLQNHISTLIEERTLYDYIEDSTGGSIDDNAGNPIQGSTVFRCDSISEKYIDSLFD